MARSDMSVAVEQAAAPPHLPLPPRLARLEAEAIHIIREVAASFRNPVLL